jgi:hypothetical protein
MAQGPVPVYIVPTPTTRKKPWWAGIVAYARYIAWGMAILFALSVCGWLSWFFT